MVLHLNKSIRAGKLESIENKIRVNELQTSHRNWMFLPLKVILKHNINYYFRNFNDEIKQPFIVNPAHNKNDNTISNKIHKHFSI